MAKKAARHSPSLAALQEAFWDEYRAQCEQVEIRFGKGEDQQSLGELAGRILAAFQESGLAKPPGRILGVEEELRGQVAAL